MRDGVEQKELSVLRRRNGVANDVPAPAHCCARVYDAHGGTITFICSFPV